MNIAQIRKYDVANGSGVRVSVFVSGCNFNCYNCFNKQYQDFKYGEPFSVNHIKQIQNELDKDMVGGLSILGGEPMEHVDSLLLLIDNLDLRDDQDIWLWSGYTYDNILRCKDKSRLLQEIDVLVDGLFVESMKDLTLKFRGSSNQRIIDVRASLLNNDIKLWEG